MAKFYIGQTDYIDQLNSISTLAGSGSGQFLPGNASAPSISFVGNNGAGMYWDQTNPSNPYNQLAFATSGIRRAYIEPAGLFKFDFGAIIAGNFTTTGPTNAVNIASDQTSGVINLGSATGTGLITVGQSTAAQTVAIASGTTVSGVTKTVNIGTGGASGSTTNIIIGSATGTTTTTIYGASLSGTLNLTSPAITTSITTPSTSFDLINTTATTLNIGSAATTLNIAGAVTALNLGNTATGAQSVNMFANSTGASTYNFATGATVSGIAKNINIGIGGVAGSTTNIIIGSSAGGGTTTIYGLTNPAITTGITTPSTSFDLLNTTATTLNIAGAATTLNLGNTATAAQTVNMFANSTGASTYNFASGATVSGVTKTVNIGTGGAAGSTTNITIGSPTGTTNTTIYGLSFTNPSITTGIITPSTTFNLINTTATILNIGGAANSITLGYSNTTTLFKGNLTTGDSINSSKLQVNGNTIGEVGIFWNYGTALPYGIDVSFRASDPANNNIPMIYCATTGGTKFFVSSTGIVKSVGSSGLSDRREKTNFAPAKSYLDIICAIPIQTFNYINQNHIEDPGLTLGVVAQDVQAIAPEFVHESDWGTKEEPRMRLSVYTQEMQYAIMKALQELKAEFDAYKTTHP